MLRKTLTLVLAVVFLLLTACGSNETSSDNASSAVNSESSQSATSSAISPDDDFWDPEIADDSETTSTTTTSSQTQSNVESTVTDDDEVDLGYEMTNAQKKYSDYIDYRCALPYTYKKLTEKKELNIIYYGGSVTVGGTNSKSWRRLVGNWFEENFPNAKINNMCRAIGSSGSRFGLYRLSRDVLPYKPDLMFIEFAINDYYQKESSSEASMMLETMIREIKTAYPECDIVTVLTTEKAHGNSLFSQASAHYSVSDYYNIPTINVGGAAVNRIGENYSDRWTLFFEDSVHPKTEGHKYYYDCIEEFLINALKNTKYKASAYAKKSLPTKYSSKLFDGNRTYVEITADVLAASEKLGGHGFEISDGTVYDNSVPHKYVVTNEENAEFVFEFTGTDFEITGGSDKDTAVEITVDGVKSELDNINSRSIPKCVVSGLAPGKHKVVIKIPAKNVKLSAVMYRDSSKATE